MPARLELLRGTESGRRYDIGDKEISIGRDLSSFVVLHDRAVSRTHASVFFDQDCYWLKASGRNPTFLNGKAVANQAPVPLNDGDQIEICDSLLEFHCDLPIADDETADSSNISHSVDARPNPEAIAEIDAAGKLRVMLRISETLGRTLDTQTLLTNTIDGLLEIFPLADHALVLLADGERLVSRVDRDRHGGERRCKYSATLVREAMASRRAILSNNLTEEKPVPITDSIRLSCIRSVLCVPLLSQKLDPLGVIELDAQDTEAHFTAADLELLNCVARQVSLSLEYSQLHRRQVEQARWRRELDVARVIQHAFLPRSMPALEGYGFWAFYQATGMIGGDYYDFVRLPGGRLAVLLGDVAGKGVPAALMMARLSGICRSALLSCAGDLCAALAAINREVCEVASDGNFVTLVLCVIDQARHEIKMASAGHMSPIVRRGDGRLEEPADGAVRGVPLGLIEGEQYKAVTRALGPGECVVLFSDGISDAWDAQQRAYSTARIRAAVAGMAKTDPVTVGEGILQDVWRHSAGQPQCDDMVMVVFGRVAAEHGVQPVPAPTGTKELLVAT